MSDEQEKMYLNIEEKNELLFKLKIRGSEKNPAVRLVFEDEECSYSIPGSVVEDESGLYRFDIPMMANKGVKEGLYKSKVEVVVEGRMFSPLNFDTVFQAPVEVQSEGLKVRKRSLNEMIEMAPTPVTVKKVSVPDGSFNSLDELLKPGSILPVEESSKPIFVARKPIEEQKSDIRQKPLTTGGGSLRSLGDLLKPIK